MFRVSRTKKVLFRAATVVVAMVFGAYGGLKAYADYRRAEATSMLALYEDLVSSQKSLEDLETESLPESYDMRSAITLTAKDQGQHNLCWAFSALTSIETYFAMKGQNIGDLSERHVDYLTSDIFNEGGSEDGLEYSLEGRALDGMGNMYFVQSDYLMKGHSPVLETAVPLEATYSPAEYDDLYSLASEIYVTSPVIGGWGLSGAQKSELLAEELTEIRNQVKALVKDYGSVATIVVAPEEGSYNEATHAAYNSTTVPSVAESGLAGDDEDGTNHAVSIVGWDDNYAKENFLEGNRPTSDGAYIALNSYGTEWGDNGYYYISYEDAAIDNMFWAVMDATTDKDEATEWVSFNNENIYNVLKNNRAVSKIILQHNDMTKKLGFLKGSYRYVESLDLSNSRLDDLSELALFRNVERINLSGSELPEGERLFSELDSVEGGILMTKKGETTGGVGQDLTVDLSFTGVTKSTIETECQSRSLSGELSGFSYTLNCLKNDGLTAKSLTGDVTDSEATTVTVAMDENLYEIYEDRYNNDTEFEYDENLISFDWENKTVTYAVRTGQDISFIVKSRTHGNFKYSLYYTVNGEAENIRLKVTPATLTVKEGGSVTKEAIIVRLIKSDGTEEIIHDYTIVDGFDVSKDQTAAYIKYGDLTATLGLKVIEAGAAEDSGEPVDEATKEDGTDATGDDGSSSAAGGARATKKATTTSAASTAGAAGGENSDTNDTAKREAMVPNTGGKVIEKKDASPTLFVVVPAIISGGMMTGFWVLYDKMRRRG